MLFYGFQREGLCVHLTFPSAKWGQGHVSLPSGGNELDQKGLYDCTELQ